jgi:hypothetical protein
VERHLHQDCDRSASGGGQVCGISAVWWAQRCYRSLLQPQRADRPQLACICVLCSAVSLLWHPSRFRGPESSVPRQPGSGACTCRILPMHLHAVSAWPDFELDLTWCLSDFGCRVVLAVFCGLVATLGLAAHVACSLFAVSFVRPAGCPGEGGGSWFAALASCFVCSSVQQLFWGRRLLCLICAVVRCRSRCPPVPFGLGLWVCCFVVACALFGRWGPFQSPRAVVACGCVASWWPEPCLAGGVLSSLPGR